MREIANQIVLTVITEIKSRNGINTAYDLIHPSTRAEMIASMTTKVEKQLIEACMKRIESPSNNKQEEKKDGKNTMAGHRNNRT